MNKSSEENSLRREYGKDLKSRILKSARELFFAKGYFATTTRELAAQAGTSESGLFRIFLKGKYEILMAVYNDCWQEVNEEIEARLTYDDNNPRKTVIDILKIIWSLYDEKRLLMSFIIINTGNTDTLIIARKEQAIISDENLRYIFRIENLCKKFVEHRLIPEHITARAMCEAILGITEGVLLGWYIADAAPDRYLEKISLDEAVDLASIMVYGSFYGDGNKNVLPARHN